MRVSINLNELLAAYEWISSGEAAALDCEAYVGRNTGRYTGAVKASTKNFRKISKTVAFTSLSQRRVSSI